MRLKGKVALITGAGSGIGAATAELFAAEGARVVVADIVAEAAESVARQIVEAGGEAVAAIGDVSQEPEVAQMIDTAIRAFGRLDVLHNNAALTDPTVIMADADIASLDVALWDRAMAVNLRGPMLCTKHALPHMLRGGGGSIIMTGSVKALEGDMMATAYGASKAGLINLTKNIATQYGKQGIRANIMVVGLVLSETLRATFPPQLREMMESHNLTPYIGEPRHIANAALFLASDESAYMTGQELCLDGGFSAHAASLVDMARMFAARGE
jgi:NAD(P)-dependent dehydrogenase (short-subunit alcohol dehydrogenase family)